MIGKSTAADLSDYIVDPLFADPQFAGVVKLLKKGEKPYEFPPEQLMVPQLDVDFDDFFATNPEVVKRSIGLQPEAFKDFKFHKTSADKK